MDTLANLHAIFHEVFDDSSIALERSTTAEDIEAWDSVMNITLMLEVERAFKIRFSTSEIAYLRNIGDLLDKIEQKVRK